MKSIAFLINPLSAKKLKGNLEHLISQKFDKERYSVRVSYSKSPEHLTELAQEAVRSHMGIVVAVGGDGTVQKVGKELIGSTSALAIVPAGSGNGLARHFGISTDPETALEQIKSGNVREIDTVEANGEVFLNVAGVGFDGHIAHTFATSKVRGFWTYLWMVAKEYFLYRPQKYLIRYNGHSLEVRAFLISLCNASQYGNNAVIAPEAKTDDGLIDVVILNKISLFTAPWFVYLLFRGKLPQFSTIHTFQCETVEISGERLSSHMDGEPFSAGDKFICTVVPHSLRIIAPAYLSE